MIGNSYNAGYSPTISRGNYIYPQYDADYDEKMLFCYRDSIKDQIKELHMEDSPYKSQAKEIEKNLNTLVLFVERQIYEKQAMREKQKEQRKENFERMLNPLEAAHRADRKEFRLLASMSRKLTEMGRFLAAAKTCGDATMSHDFIRRASEISIELTRQIE